MKQPEKTPEQLAFEAAQAQIRACVMSPDRRTVFTWYRSGNVTVTTDGTAEQAGRAWDVAGFNSILERNGITGLQGRSALQSKCPEKSVKHG